MRFPSSRALGALLPLVLVACSSTASRDAESTSAESEDLYGLGSIAAPWTNGRVPVCFQDPTDHPELQALVPSILAGSWEKAANVSFVGFGACHDGGDQVSVSFVPVGTISSIDNIGLGARHVNLVNGDTTPGQTYFRYAVVHELGHALGFAHEMKRPDNWVGDSPKQCPPAAPNAPEQYFEQAGGAYLTPNYDPESVMNYCGPGGTDQTPLSVGDVIGVQAAYGASSVCRFQSAATACTWTTGLHAEETFDIPAGCPPTESPWVLQQLVAGSWKSVSNACGDGEPAGTCATPSPTKFLLGHQAEGGVASGPAIGSVQQMRVCDAWGNCAPSFDLTIADCQTGLDQVAIAPGNDPFRVSVGGTSSANLVMAGPWIAGDRGEGAVATVVGAPIPGVTITLAPGNAHGFVSMMISTSLATTPGLYSVSIAVTDLASTVTRTTNVNVQIDPCNPGSAATACTVPFGPMACGAHSVGCGLTTNCGTCGGDSWCSSGYCCPTGSTFSFALDACTPDAPPPPPPPPDCPRSKPYCDALHACATAKVCKGATGTCTGKLCQ